MRKEEEELFLGIADFHDQVDRVLASLIDGAEFVSDLAWRITHKKKRLTLNRTYMTIV